MTEQRSFGTSDSDPDRMVLANQLDIVVVDKQEKKVVVKDVESQVMATHKKYKRLKEELERM